MVSKNSVHIQRMVISAMFLAVALVLRVFVTADLGGGLRFSPHLVFSAMPAILFGPLYGAIVEGLTDFMGFFLRPTGPWIPALTGTAVLRGALQGCLWWLLRNRSQQAMRIVIAVFSVALIAVGGFNALSGDTSERFFANTTTQVTAAVIGAGVLGLLLLLLDWLVQRRDSRNIFSHAKRSTLPLLCTILPTAIIVNVLNSFILHPRFFAHVPFLVYAFPRVMVAVATAIVTTYLVAALLNIYERGGSYGKYE